MCVSVRVCVSACVCVYVCACVCLCLCLRVLCALGFVSLRDFECVTAPSGVFSVLWKGRQDAPPYRCRHGCVCVCMCVHVCARMPVLWGVVRVCACTR